MTLFADASMRFRLPNDAQVLGCVCRFEESALTCYASNDIMNHAFRQRAFQCLKLAFAYIVSVNPNAMI